MIKTLFKYFKPHRKIFLLDMFCAIVVASVDLAFPLVSRAAMYELLPEQKYRVSEHFLGRPCTLEPHQ